MSTSPQKIVMAGLDPATQERLTTHQQPPLDGQVKPTVFPVPLPTPKKSSSSPAMTTFFAEQVH
jgi:hypothetical protein